LEKKKKIPCTRCLDCIKDVRGNYGLWQNDEKPRLWGKENATGNRGRSKEREASRSPSKKHKTTKKNVNPRSRRNQRSKDSGRDKLPGCRRDFLQKKGLYKK